MKSNISKEVFARYRTAAAYVYITGSWPSHKREATDDWLREITIHGRPKRGTAGPIRVLDEQVVRLALPEHPMAVEIRKREEAGYIVANAADLEAYPETARFRRRPATRIYMIHRITADRIIIQEDGSILLGWASPRMRMHHSAVVASSPRQAGLIKVRHRSRADVLAAVSLSHQKSNAR